VATAFLVILTVVLPIFVAILGQALVQRLVPSSRRQEHNDVAGFIYAVLGVAYAVLLAFVAIVVWENYETAESTMESEANELAGIYFLANRFSEPDQERIHDLARSYARVVVEEEWPMMEQGKTSSRASSLLSELRLSVQNLDTPTEADLVLYDQALTRFHDLANARRLRLVAATEGLPGILWIMLIGGGVVTVCFTYLFGLKNNWAHALMIAALTLVICAILLTIGLLEYPFAGEVKVQPDAFEEVLRIFAET
jgi:ABC-type multidrug transport system fused ATPase/permease subunit